MSDFSQSDVRNLLLRALEPEAFDLLRAAMQPVALPAKLEVIAPDVPSEAAYFLESGLASVVATNADDESVEVGHVGYEGMAGAHVLLKVNQTPNRTFMQAEGHGISVPVSALLSMAERVPSANDLLLRYAHCCDLQLAHSALANARYNMPERLARWLLMCHDRLRDKNLPLTHEFLSLMLGVRRAGVTNEIHILEGVHAIKATRGNIRILDRPKLEDIAGGSYGVPEREYERLVGFPIRQA
ncbi:Crp/Fnr family transcriptional regulator [Rhizobium leguminosarum]|uniref:Putative transcriptional regulator, Crp/Fnr family n=1 Tax=Rhizobium leguminosarum bv. trifolii (strain WSM1325) TaxID=395491 RepID=C6B7H6_RHILS|nr:Crp/Fnr family transcriptional regulator [Rhizobium leguminosarum]ACS60034.1 putative transcriptional regulator, Crp/Fnr family [Rhizobium leguminosarum bv. trifolii WSM1325]MBY2934479.1 Crp/Fnr family transcriptional regulator [Rhizobium leguminosarum]MBY2942856.1 Crp/Fnr family transcriptional regulator [Rhizobium leguminosarum]MBY2967995.1 Crp/Fnr family transcriptional regulator [Rhizobium leguminosarum]RWX21812.1 Crp/Fnr family transcriptional regulator [Rhizobium leguminosarum]